MSDDVRTAAWRMFIENSARLQIELDRRLRDAGMSLHEYHLLLRLHESPGRRLRMHELRRHLVFSASRLSYQVDALCRRGWLRREPAREDRRGSYAILTEAGTAAFEAAAPAHVADVDELFFTAVPDDAWGPLADTMTHLSTHLDRFEQP
ncbi:MarR family winged helix-turn-helix transcriptional regulator [Gordonia shandongensis]|uniref:MarR family winged helix-turn-helix transcriptional regulator n=1 Tax=Gordonia shandongensis TaxID=376351 RepID=UPI0004178BFD|nr:MarR family transcriptional regulator [Gordonia shandongensis]